jgi:glycosyltransferase involved in cell wall biosynthesis
MIEEVMERPVAEGSTNRPDVEQPPGPTLTIVIPALNEEASIGQTIQRCLDARARIREEGHIGGIHIVVVSDGSTDQTAVIAGHLADQHTGVKLIIFEKNRGYGAALKEGFRTGELGEFVGFLDADGTCDPLFFAELCRAIQMQRADVALGNRMLPESHMPRLRRVGNRIFALLLGFLSGQYVADTASGMRVIRRCALQHLYPLPDGLDFTPAMSARAVMQGMRIIELPMPYAERVGRSKLSVVRDGFRFLWSIVDAVLVFSPTRMFNLAFVFCMILLLALAVSPIEQFLRHGEVEYWMLYRFMVCLLLATGGFTLLCTGVVADDLLFLTNQSAYRTAFTNQLLKHLLGGRRLLLLAVLLTLLGLWCVSPGLLEYVQTSHVTTHWARVVAGTLCFLLALQAAVTASLRRIIALWQEHQRSGARD